LFIISERRNLIFDVFAEYQAGKSPSTPSAMVLRLRLHAIAMMALTVMEA
jgi:hypothetical protein